MSTSEAQEYPYRFVLGQVIDGRFKVLEPLGHGGFAEVYKCRDIKLDQVFAVKVMNLQVSQEILLREARTAAKFQHPNILRVVNIGEIDDTGNMYLVMDYEEGSRSLEVVLDQVQENLRRLPLDEKTLRIISQVASALHYAHGMGVIHRDVKPSNIIIDAKDNAYLTDFGLATVKRQPGDSMKTLDAQSSMSGTIPYMSPEQFEERETDKPIGASSDVYSLGVVAYEMLVGQLPYPGKAMAPIIRQIIDGVRTPPRQLNSEIKEQVQRVLLRVLDKDPEKRYQTPVEFARRLQAAAQSYITAENLYNKARSLFDQRDYRAALESLTQLEEHESGYKETKLFLERAKKQVQLLDLYEEAGELHGRGEHEACLDKLKVLTEIDPNYVVTKLRDEALSSLTEQLYSQANDLYQSGDYQACLDTFQEIYRHVPGFPDQNGLRQLARRRVDHNDYLQTLYQSSIEQIRQEDWAEALRTLETLQGEEEGYADVEARLTMVRHMDRLSGMLRLAQRSYDLREFGACIDHLRELVQIDKAYKAGEIEELRQQAVTAMYQQAQQLLDDERYEQAIETVDALNGRTAHGDPDDIQERARYGIAARQLNKEVTDLYVLAGQQLDVKQYSECLQTMRAIRDKDPQFPDVRDYERRAREQNCISLYDQALTALTGGQYQEARDLWKQVAECDPNYPDRQDVYQKALDGMKKGRWLRAAIKTLKGWFEAVTRVLSDRRVRMVLLIGVVVVIVAIGGIFVVRGVVENNRARATETAEAIASETADAAKANATANAEKTRVASAAATATAEALEIETTATAQAIATVTAVAEATQAARAAEQAAAQAATATAAYQATRDAIASATAVAATATASYRATQSAEQTAVAEITLTAEAMIATANANASILPAPVWPSTQLGYVSEGETVTVLGRASDDRGAWLYVRTLAGVEGFAYADLFDWGGDAQSLPVVTPTVTVVVTPTSTTKLSVTPGTLGIEHIWPRTECVAGGWKAHFEVKIQGGNGRDYTLYWDTEEVEYERKQDEPDVAIVVRDGSPGLLVGTITVHSGGDTASLKTSASPPDCN